MAAPVEVGKKNVEVTFEDQQQINAFSKLSGRQHELQDILKVKSSELEDLEDAGNELMLVDEEEVPFAVGEGFFHAAVPESEERLEQATKHVQEAVESYKAELKVTLGQMNTLKQVLYGRLGRENINLEE